MPQTDTLTFVKDSLKLALDTLQQKDSDVVVVFKGYEGVLRVPSPATEPWVFILIMLAFAFVVLAVVRSTNPISNVFTSFFNKRERTSLFLKTSIDNFEQKFCFFNFSVISISLFAYLNFQAQNLTFIFTTYLWIMVIVLVFLLFKYLAAKVITYVFFDKSIERSLYDSYLSVMRFISMLLFPITLLQLYSTIVSPEIARQYAISVVVIGLMLLLLKLLHIFYNKLIVFLYIMLYLCTLEILPLLILLEAFQIILKGN
ncbi:MAG: hypothetical protein AUK44_01330 [Porphyromonadaceae bacterium CG2_30_38_12]|nr:MAG: hypothetical protein AUK44_01330 [Porphyromonadaceae bacterium CG2_30_38_12]